MKPKHILSTIIISALTTLGVIFGYSKIHESNNPNFQSAFNVPANYKYAGLFNQDGSPGAGPADFTQAAAAAVPTVVHITTMTNPRQVNNNLPNKKNPFTDMFGDDLLDQLFGNGNRQSMPQKASGSGVIISEDGYIVTNNHVVAGADEVTVTLSNKKSYIAKVIGADPSYDLAVVKINTSNLPFMLYGNSDETKVGQWILAIGYPLTLETTVTAGIISAKGRTLGLNRDKMGNAGVESFIQTDAAVNMGNSGGALINTNGQLIGINSAIASPTGVYAGYSYAIPVNIVRKVINDLIKYGSVQRGFLGAQYIDATGRTDEEKKQLKLPATADGIFITNLSSNGAAKAAGIKEGDIIRKINDVNIFSGSDMQEQLSNYKPGDKVNVTYERNGVLNTVAVSLKNSSGNFDIVKAETMLDRLGADLVTLDGRQAKNYGIAGGVIVKKINNGGVIDDQTRMRDGFIITKANGKAVKSVDELRSVIGTSKDVKIEGVYPGYEETFEYPLDLGDNK
ncbi:MAG: HtrA protease/chaperone protein [Chitinophagaceae bacterium]|nr:HtrA protease/chaperone protein [Chitinophagaceae bacterium]MDB5223864.1 HtrA protease/chaperone protein [Chitinophagaceae bacterium]